MKVYSTCNAPKAVGPYSQAMRTGNLLFVSGQIPLVPDTGELVIGGVKEQTEQVLKNVIAVLNSAELTLKNVVMANVYMTDLSQFAIMNAVYAEFFGDHKPARAAVQVGALPKGAQVEISVVAEL